MLKVKNSFCPRRALDSAGCVQEDAAQGSAVQRKQLSLAGHIFPGWLCRDRHRAAGWCQMAQSKTGTACHVQGETNRMYSQRWAHASGGLI